jgi:hypothetical protein
MLKSSDDAVERFAGYVGLAALDRPFISKTQERSLLADGIAKFNLTAEQARGILLSVAQADGISVERDVDARILSVLERYGGRRKKLKRKRFGEAAAIYRAMTGDILPEAEARIRVKRVMEANGFRAKRGGWTMSRRWYRRIDRAERKRAGKMMQAEA